MMSRVMHGLAASSICLIRISVVNICPGIAYWGFASRKNSVFDMIIGFELFFYLKNVYMDCLLTVGVFGLK